VNPELARLLDLAENADPGTRIEYCAPVAQHGVEAVAAVGPWLSDPRLGRFAVRVVAAAARHGAQDEAVRVLLDVLEEPVTPGLGDDLVWYLDRLDSSWRRRRRRPRSRFDTVVGRLAKDPSRPRRYMHAWTLWHRIVDSVVPSDGRLRYLGACHRWNNQSYVDSGSRRIRSEPPAGEYCHLCEQAETRATGTSPRNWSAVRAEWAEAGERLHLRREKVWHLGVTDDEIVTDDLGAMYLTECGWWIEKERVVAGGRSGPVSPICDVCVTFIRWRDAKPAI